MAIYGMLSRRKTSGPGFAMPESLDQRKHSPETTVETPLAPKSRMRMRMLRWMVRETEMPNAREIPCSRLKAFSCNWIPGTLCS